MFKRFASIFLALIMVLGVFPVGALAEGSLQPTRQRADVDDSRMYVPETGEQNLFSQSRSNFGESDFQGNVVFTYKGSKTAPADIVAELTANGMNDYFIPSLRSPAPEYTVVESILCNGKSVPMIDVTINNINLSGNAFKLIEFMPLCFKDPDGELCNASDEYTVTWKTESGEAHTDVIRYEIVFFEEEDVNIDPTCYRADIDDVRIYPADESQNIFSQSRSSFDGSVFKGRVIFSYNGNEETPENILAKLTANGMNDYFIPSLRSPAPKYTVVESILCNGESVPMSNVTVKDINLPGGTLKLIEFMPLCFKDPKGGLCNASDEYTVIWKTANGETHTDVIRYEVVFFEEDNGEQGGDQGGHNPIRSEAAVTGGTTVPVKESESLDELYEYWNFEDIILKNQIKVTAPGNLANYLECSYDEYGIITVKLKNNVPASVWKEAYDQLEPNSTHLGVDIEIYAPGNYTQVATFHGNGDYGNLLKQYENDPDKVTFYKFNPEMDNVGSGYYIAQIITEEDKITIIPDGSDGIYFSALIWKNGNEVKKQILLFRYEIEEGTKNESFENLRRPAQKVIFDDRTEEENPVLKAEYDRDSGYLKYTYIGSKTNDSEIAGDFIGQSGENTIYTLVTAPEGYRCAEGNDTFYVFGLSIDSPDSAIVGRTASFDAKWVNDDGDTITEGITIEFDPGKTWMDIYWDPVSTERIVYIDGKDNFVSKEELAKAGLSVNDSEGYVYSDFAENLGSVDIETIANASVILLPPDAVEREEGESIEAWIERVYENTQYKNYAYVHTSGPNGYDPDFADMQLNGFDEREIESLEENGNNTQITVANFDKRTINGINVWFGENERRGYSYKVLVNWIGEGNNAVSEYFYTEQEQFYLEHTEEAKEKIDSVVEEVTPLGSDWKLTVNHFPQAGRDDAYYFEMEADGNVPDGKKTIYVPYSYLDENLTYEKAVAMGLKPKLHHYNDGYTQIELLKGELTKYGMKFTVESFSPFVIAYDINEEVEQKVVIDEKLETVPESLKEKFDSADEMKNALEKEIFEKTEITESETGIKFMEITLQMKAPNGEWIEVTKENFPEEGLEVLIPYPEETSAESHKFAVAHLISSGEKLGEIEILVPEETADGLLIKVHSLSPFAVAYEEESNDGENDETEEKPSVRPIRPVWGGGNKVTIIDGREEEKNPETGAPVFEISSAIAVLSTAAVICFRKKK